MSEKEQKWKYVAEYRISDPCVTKVRLKETPQNWRVLEAIAVYGGQSYNLREGRLIRKSQYRNQIFDWYDEALESLDKRLGRMVDRARSTLNEYIHQREDIQHAIGESRAIGTTERPRG